MAINLVGRIPIIKEAISPRTFWLGAGVALLLIVGVVVGFKVRFTKQEERRQQQQAASIASDAAQSNRGQVEGGVIPASNLAGLPTTPAQSSPSVAVTPTGQMPTANPNGQPLQPAPPVMATGAQTPAYTPQPTAPMYAYQPASAPVVDPAQQLRQQLTTRRLEREQQAIDGPTGLQEQRAATAPSSDPQLQELSTLRTLLQSQNGGPPIPYPSVPQSNPGTGDSEGGQGYRTQNGQADKRQFQEGGEGPADDYLKTTRTPPLSRWVVQRGTVIPATLPHKLVSDLPGDLIAEVARDVYDSPTQKFVEIPAGSRLVGEYNSSVSFGQNRVQVVWIAIYFPDGSFIDLDRMPSHSADGSAGLKDQVDNHWTRTIAGVALSSLLSAGLSISQNRSNGSNSVLNYPSTGQVAASAVGTQAAQLGQQLTNRNLNVQPTLKIRPGEIFAVSVKKDILFQGPYQPMEVK